MSIHDWEHSRSFMPINGTYGHAMKEQHTELNNHTPSLRWEKRKQPSTPGFADLECTIISQNSESGL